MKTKTFWGVAALLGGALLVSGSGAQAQVTPGAPGRLAVVEIKDATLYDAINLVFRSAGVALPIQDDSAKAVVVPDIVRTNIAWDDLIRQLAPSKDWRFYKGPSGQYIIEPRAPQAIPGQEGAPFGSPGSFPGTVPSNPFGGGFNRRRTQASPLVRPAVETQANSQTRPRVPGAGGRAGAGTGATGEPLQYRPIIINHVYAGGIALLFGGFAIPTEIFVTPGVRGGGGNQGVGVTGTGTGGGLGGGIGGGGGLGGGIGSGGIGGGLGGGIRGGTNR